MKLGFVTAIVPELGLDAVLDLASETGYSCVEVMCWPPGKAERRYAGTSHIDVTEFDADAVKRIQDLTSAKGIGISSLGYYPNPLAGDSAEAEVASSHLRKVIDASQALGLNLVTTFVGRDPKKSIDDNWPRFLETWRPLIRYAEDRGVRVGIENCPMLFSADEWPGGKNLAISPAIWRRMFNDIPSPNFGLNFDPSHFVWQGIDSIPAMREFKDKLFHIHAKDARLDRDRLNEHGVLSHPKLWHTPKLPGLGDVHWGSLIAVLSEVGYDGPVVVEVEDRAFEGPLAKRKDSLIISRRYLSQFIAG